MGINQYLTVTYGTLAVVWWCEEDEYSTIFVKKYSFFMRFTFLIHNLRMQYPLPEVSPVFMALENTAPLVCAAQLLCLFIINSTHFAWHGHANESRAAVRGSGLCLQGRQAWGTAHCPG